jgi:hypothetical protein
MTVMEDVRATIPGLREVLPDLREALPDVGAVLPDLREAMPDARAAFPALREGLADLRDDLRADLPGPWRRERPSIVRQGAIVVVIALAVIATAWVVMAFVERRRLQARSGPPGEDELALARAEDEGMGTTIVTPSTPPAEPPAARRSPATPAMGVVPNAVSPMVGARSVPSGSASSEEGETDGR